MTVTSNIHVGLPGWSNATYSVGQRRSNAGNAYQVITAGTSTSPPTGTGSTITPGGTSAWKWLSAVDYSTLQAWADGIPATLTQPVVGLLWNDGVITATAGTSILTLTGHTTSSTNTITLAPATGEGFLATFQIAPTTPYRYNNANGVSIELPATGFGGINYVNVDDSNFIIRGMQFKDLNASSGASIIGGNGTIWIDKSIIVGQGQSGGANIIGKSVGSIKITNCLIIDNSVGSPGATVSAPGVGCAIAYTTIVKTAPATGSSALDASTNPTAASNTAVGCIFAGYDVPLSAASVQAWTTNHNAYTNSSFTSTAAATDTGGSVYGATTATLFVSFASSSPFSAEFSSEFGGGSSSTFDYHQNPTSPCLNAGVTDTTDIPTSDDTFGTSRPQGAAWDIGPHELLAGSVILRDFIHPIAFSRSAIRDIVVPITWNYGIAKNIQMYSEWRQPQIFDRIVPIDNKASYPYFSLSNPFSGDFSSDFGAGSSWAYDPNMPIEFRSNVAQAVRDVSFPLEWKVAIAVNRVIPDDWRSTITRDTTTGVDWRGNQIRDAVISSEFGTSRSADTTLSQTSNITKFSDGVVPTVFSQSFSKDVINPVDWRGSSVTFVDTGIPIDWRGPFTTFGDAVVPIDWQSFSITSADASIPIDWRAPFTQSAALSIEFVKPAQVDTVSSAGWTNAVVGTDYVASFEAKSTPVTDAVGNIDWLLPFSLTAPVAMDFGLSVVNTAPSSLEFIQSVALTIAVACDPYLLLLADKIGSVEPSASRIASVLVPTDVGGGTGVGIPADSVISLEWRGGIMADTPIGVSSVNTVAADMAVPLSSDASKIVDYALGSAFSSTPLMTIVVPSDWGHLTFGLTVEMVAALEILATVRADIPIASNQLVGQRSIGSSLEPDEWEEENEPS